VAGALDARLAAALERVAQAVRVMRWDAAHAHGLSPAQLSVLVILAQAPARRRRVSALAAELDLTAPTVSDAVAALRRKGLVSSAPAGGRGQVLDLTEDGRRLLGDVARWDGPLLAAVASLPTAVKESALVAMLEVVADLQRSGVITVARMCTTCRFFRRTGDVPRCGLVGAPLPPAALRVDCPEHESVA
jgi:DNA-binding MarR family transcriptional regulator